MEVPFLEREVLEIRANQLPLYKLMFVPAHPTLALIGFVQPLGTTSSWPSCRRVSPRSFSRFVVLLASLGSFNVRIALLAAQTFAVSKYCITLIFYFNENFKL